METYISIQDVANIITFVAPGYFAIKTYNTVNSKDEPNFSQLLIACVVVSLPIVGAYSFLWSLVSDQTVIFSNARHAPLLILFAILIGFVCANLRRFRYVRRLTSKMRLPSPDGDFMKVQFNKLDPIDPVMIKLKNGELLSGTPQGGSTFKRGGPRLYYFNNICWFDKEKEQWDERPGSVIIDLTEIDYIETLEPLVEN